MENAAHTVQLSVAGGSLAGCEVSHWHTNTQRIIRAAHGNIHRTGGMTARLLKASEGKFGDVALTLSSVHFLSARNLFHNSFCRKNICEMDKKRRSALGSRTACSATGCTHHVLSYKSIFCRVSCHFTDVRSFQRKCLWIDQPQAER